MKIPHGSICVAALLAAATAFLLSAPASAGLIGYWSFDGCTTTDAGPNALHLTPGGGPVCVPGRFGTAWSFDGASQYLDHGPTSIFEPGTRAWSVALWEKSTQEAGYHAMVGWYRCGANPGCRFGDGADYIMALQGGRANWDVRGDLGIDETLEDSVTVVADGEWHFLVGTMNPATDSTKLYVDGALRVVSHAVLGGLNSGGVAIPLDVGRLFRQGWAEPSYYFGGALDEIRIFDEELSATAVAGLFSGNAITAVGSDGPRDLAIERCWPNPTRGGRSVVTFSLASDADAELAVFDVNGRRISRVSGLRGAGRHEVDLGGGRALAPGIYLIRLTQNGASAMRRVTVLE